MPLTDLPPVDHERLVDAMVELVNANSGSANVEGITNVQHKLARMLEPVGAARVSEPITIDSLDDAGRQSTLTCGPQLELNLRPDLERRLLIVGHADTVFPPTSDFQTATRVDDRLYGPGAADMKGGLVIAIEALRLLESQAAAHSVGIDFLVTGDEETGSLASAPRISELAANAFVGLALEPPMNDGAFARARAGSANITIIVDGTSAHAGRALADGRNAVVAAGRLAIEAAALGANVASIQGGGAFNAVPDRAVMRLNKRGSTPDEIDRSLTLVRDAAARIADEFGVEFSFYGHQHRPAKPWRDDHQRLADLVRAAGDQVGCNARFVDTFGVCDGNNMAAEGCAVVDTLGIKGANIHTRDEYAEIGDLDQQVHFLADLVSRIASDWNK